LERKLCRFKAVEDGTDRITKHGSGRALWSHECRVKECVKEYEGNRKAVISMTNPAKEMSGLTDGLGLGTQVDLFGFSA